MLDVTNLIVYINGAFLPGREARISVFDRGLIYGDAVFEGIREYSGRVFRLDEHLDRLYESAQVFNLRVPLSKMEMKEVILETLRRNQLQDAHIRPIITRGVGVMGVNPGQEYTPTVIVLAHPWAPFLGEEGIRVKTAAVRRVPPQCLDSRVKHVGFQNSVMASLEASAAGANEALLLDVHGFVTEGPGTNFLIVKNSVLISPTTVNILDGITRRTVMALAQEAGMATAEKNLTLGDVYTSDEAFMCGTGAEVVPVVEVDGRRIGLGTPSRPDGTGMPGPVTRQLMDSYKALVHREGTPVW